MESKAKGNRFVIIAFIFCVSVNASYCKNIYKVQIPTNLCKPCEGSGNRRNDGRCGLLRNDTFDILNEVQAEFLGPIRDDLQAERELLGGVLTSDTDIQLYDIKDLKDIETSSISKYLRSGNKVEKIIHHSYGRLMIQIAYLNLYKDILSRHQGLNDKVKDITRVDEILKQSQRLSCRLFDYTSMLGIKKIKKRLCKLIDEKSFTENRNEKEYSLSILQWVVKSFESTIDAMQSLNSPEVTENCNYECGRGKVTLICKQSKQFRNAPTGRKNRRNRKNKNKERRRKNKGRKDCKKNKGTAKSNKRQCRNRRRNKKKSQKRTNRCFKCK